MERLIELTKKHKEIMDTKNIIVCVYTNASGFLWSMAKVDSGTGLGWSEDNGNNNGGGSFIQYEDALEDALNLIDKCDLEQFQKENQSALHWSNYAGHLNEYYRTANKPR